MSRVIPRAGDLLLWPDGTWCLWEDRGEYGWMSDDYEVIPGDSDRARELQEGA